MRKILVLAFVLGVTAPATAQNDPGPICCALHSGSVGGESSNLARKTVRDDGTQPSFAPAMTVAASQTPRRPKFSRRAKLILLGIASVLVAIWAPPIA